jgi:hypothetical protein
MIKIWLLLGWLILLKITITKWYFFQLLINNICSCINGTEVNKLLLLFF